jgi:hypothetical protein
MSPGASTVGEPPPQCIWVTVCVPPVSSATLVISRSISAR